MLHTYVTLLYKLTLPVRVQMYYIKGGPRPQDGCDAYAY